MSPSLEIPPSPPPGPAPGGGLRVHSGPEPEPDRWVDEHGDYLFSYAMFRLRDPAKAQDVVQETFLAALRSGLIFRGVAAERGWLVGVLKHKIHDLFRQLSRETPFSDLGVVDNEESGQFVEHGLRQGAWNRSRAPRNWPMNPDEDLDRSEFWKTFRVCAAKLPRVIAQAFLLRELDGLGTREICEILGIKENNLWVMLHRARGGLRQCLETNWFDRATIPFRKPSSRKANESR